LWIKTGKIPGADYYTLLVECANTGYLFSRLDTQAQHFLLSLKTHIIMYLFITNFLYLPVSSRRSGKNREAYTPTPITPTCYWMYEYFGVHYPYSDYRRRLTMSNHLVDITVHIDEDLSPEQRALIEERIRDLEGIVSVHNSSNAPHLTVVEYDMDEMTSQQILQRVAEQGVHAELIGM